MKLLTVSIVIPVFNEEKTVNDCVKSLLKQNYPKFEIILIDDGSTDSTLQILTGFKESFPQIKIFTQNHLGPARARNLGVEHAVGEIVVFVDADMVFDPSFISNLVLPINRGLSIGTFSKEEYVLNKENVWSKCWNINKNLPVDRMHPADYPETQPVFRAILKTEFLKVEGFKPIGYIDDYTLSEKLKVFATNAPKAIFYHQNPGSLKEVFHQARWIGKSEFKRRKIKNESLMKCIALVRFSIPFSLINGISKALKNRIPHFLLFKLIYDFAIEISLLKSFFNEQINK